MAMGGRDLLCGIRGSCGLMVEAWALMGICT
jgi:hypothetical protein